MAGQPRKVKTPEELWLHFVSYRKSIEDNPRYKVDYVGKDGNRVHTPLRVPLTIEGFKNYCYGVFGCVRQYLENQHDLYDEYVDIVTRIKDEIRQDQIEGGMVGQYNSNITARLNGLADKTETQVRTEPRIFNVD
jgi:hypothetical protein